MRALCSITRRAGLHMVRLQLQGDVGMGDLQVDSGRQATCGDANDKRPSIISRRYQVSFLAS